MLEKELGVSVVGMTARSGEGVEELLSELSGNKNDNVLKIKYNGDIESAIEYIEPVLKKYKINKPSQRWLALRLLEDDPSVKNYIDKSTELSDNQKNEISQSVQRGKNSFNIV